MLTKKMLTMNEVMARYKVTHLTIYRWMENGIFPKSIKIGWSARWREEDLDQFDKTGDIELIKINSAELQNTLTRKDVTARYNVIAATIYRWTETGIFPKPIKIGNAVRWRKDDLDRFDKTGEIEVMQTWVEFNELEKLTNKLMDVRDEFQVWIDSQLEFYRRTSILLNLPEYKRLLEVDSLAELTRKQQEKFQEIAAKVKKL